MGRLIGAHLPILPLTVLPRVWPLGQAAAVGRLIGAHLPILPLTALPRVWPLGQAAAGLAAVGGRLVGAHLATVPLTVLPRVWPLGHGSFVTATGLTGTHLAAVPLTDLPRAWPLGQAAAVVGGRLVGAHLAATVPLTVLPRVWPLGHGRVVGLALGFVLRTGLRDRGFMVGFVLGGLALDFGGKGFGFVPGCGTLKHAVAPARDVSPGPQLAQTPAPGLAENVSTAHGRQRLDPSGANFPAAQATQVAAAAEPADELVELPPPRDGTCPAGHCCPQPARPAVVEVEPSEPGGQTLHVVEPGVALK